MYMYLVRPCSAEVFRTYKNTNLVFSKAKPHPGNIVEAACLAVSESR